MTDCEYCVLDSMKVVMSINNEDLDQSLAEHLQEPYSIDNDYNYTSILNDQHCNIHNMSLTLAI